MTTGRASDLVVLGGGSGGYAAALRAAELGASVTLIERGDVGGTCLHRGCIPTKAMLHAGEVADAARAAHEVGVRAELHGIDIHAVHAFRDKIVARKFQGLQGLLRARGVTVVNGEGAVEADRTVSVGTDTYRGENLVLATGARSRSLPFAPWGPRILDSEAALALDEIPGRVLVLGGGVIGVEFASLWRSLGADVTIVEAAAHLLPTEEPTVSTALERAFRKRGIHLVLGAGVTGVSATDSEVTVTLADGDALTADDLLVAVGRAPVTEAFGSAGVALDDRGFVAVDEHLATSVPGVWAVGDIVAGPQLAHRGFAHGIRVAERIAGREPIAQPDHIVPRVTYSHPEVASIGFTEAEAIDRFGADGVASLDYNLAGNARSEIIGTAGLVRVIRRASGPVVGVHMIGDRVGELITQAQLVVGWDAHPEDVAPLVHAHPTQSEALGEAMLALSGTPLHTL